MPDQDASKPSRSPRRLPRSIEREVAKFLNTFGFSDYGAALWSLAERADGDRAAQAATIPDSIWAQIKAQARHDPSVLAAGEIAVPRLRQLRRTTRLMWGADATGLLKASGARPDVIFVVPKLDAAAQEEIDASSAVLRDLGARSVLIVVTDQRRDGNAAYGEERVVYWLDHCSGGSAASARVFALFVHAVGASLVVVVGSRIGMEAFVRYGRALKRFHRLFFRLDPPPSTRAHLFKEVHHLRGAAPHATVLAISEADAGVLRTYCSGTAGPGVKILPRLGGASELADEAFGRDFSDCRSGTSRTVIDALRRAPSSERYDAERFPRSDSRGSEIDITVTIVFHVERALAVPALASLADMIAEAKDAGLTVEARAVLDKPDAVTRRLVETHGQVLDDVQEVRLGDLALARNAGTAKARGRYLAFLDGDDLWGAGWLRQAHEAATAHGSHLSAVWHPTLLYSFFASDCDRFSATDVPLPTAWSTYLLQPSSQDAGFEPADLLLENLWSANAFAAAEIYRRFPYRPIDLDGQAGIEDWRWNLQTLASGIPHLLVPDTIHLIRQKEGGSLGQVSDAQGLLPVFD